MNNMTMEDRNGIICFATKPSDGKTKEDWVKHLKSKGHQLSPYLESCMLATSLIPSMNKIYKIEIIRGEMFPDGDRSRYSMTKEAEQRGLKKLNVEATYLVCDILTSEEMKMLGLLCLYVTGNLVGDCADDLEIIGLSPGSLQTELHVYHAQPHLTQARETGFAFEAK